MSNPYIYTRQNSSVKIENIDRTDGLSRYWVKLSSNFQAKYLGDNQIIGEYWYPEVGKQSPLAILVHGMGDRSVIPCHLIAHTLAKKGVASFILYLVFHQKRVSPTIRDRYPNLTAEEWFESYQISVIDIHQVIDWAETRSELIQGKISILGISFGSFVSAIAMALDPRIKAGILVESGGNSDKITRRSLVLRQQYKHTEAEYRRSQESYAQYLAEIGEKGFENVIACKSSYLTDPMTFSKYLRNRPLLMLNAIWDEIIPKSATLDLWAANGKPSIRWYPATHASIWMWYPFLSPVIADFLRSTNGAGIRR